MAKLSELPVSLTPQQSPREFGPTPVPDNWNVVILRVPTWPEANRTLAAFVEITYDGDVTWEHLFSQNPWPGGSTAVGPDGTTDSTVVVRMRPPEGGIGRRVRATLTATGGRVSTTVVVEVLE